MNFKKYLWLIPSLYVAYFFGGKIIEGLSGSQEFADIISVVGPLAPISHALTPVIGILDFCIAAALILNPFTLKNDTLQKFLFVWTIVWPFVPSSLRYFGGVAEFEIVEVLSISIAAALGFYLWRAYTMQTVSAPLASQASMSV